MMTTVVLMDVVGSAALWSALPGARMMALLDALTKEVAETCQTHHGVLVKTIGDAYMLVFDRREGLVNAVQFALEMQTRRLPRLARRRWADLPPVRMRVGVASGPVHRRTVTVQGCKQQDVFGPTVNLAARAESVLSPLGGMAVAVTAQQGPHVAAVLRVVRPAAKRVSLVEWTEAAATATATQPPVSSREITSNSANAGTDNNDTRSSIRSSSRSSSRSSKNSIASSSAAASSLQMQTRPATQLRGVMPVPVLRVHL